MNPIVGVIDGSRWSVLGGENRIYLPGFVMSVIMVGILLSSGVWYFRKTERAQIGNRSSNQDGVVIFATCNMDSQRRFVPIRKGVHTFQVSIPANLIIPGTCTLQVASHISARHLFDVIENSSVFCVEETGSVALITNDFRFGVMNPILAWNPV